MEPGFMIKGRYRIKNKFAVGSYGDLYSGDDSVNGRLVAVKFEPADSRRKSVKNEALILKMLQECNCVPRYILSGTLQEGHFIVMQMLGNNLNELRHQQPEKKFSIATTMRLGIQMLRGIELVHSFGYIHRDVKPSNFAMGLGASRGRCFIFDFGLSRKYLSEDGKIIPERAHVGFRGTARYSSLNAHTDKDLSRRDDLWSLYYCLIEFLRGRLPWKSCSEKADIYNMKMQYHNPDFVRGLPGEFTKLFEYLDGLGFEDEPDYVFVENVLYDVYTREGYHHQEIPYDWELISSSDITLQNGGCYVNSSVIQDRNENTNGPIKNAPIKDEAKDSKSHSSPDSKSSNAISQTTHETEGGLNEFPPLSKTITNSEYSFRRETRLVSKQFMLLHFKGNSEASFSSGILSVAPVVEPQALPYGHSLRKSSSTRRSTREFKVENRPAVLSKQPSNIPQTSFANPIGSPVKKLVTPQSPSSLMRHKMASRVRRGMSETSSMDEDNRDPPTRSPTSQNKLSPESSRATEAVINANFISPLVGTSSSHLSRWIQPTNPAQKAESSGVCLLL